MAAVQISTQDFTGSFDSAFGQARNSLGFPGIFVWCGKPYHTGTEEEISAMSPEEWSAFSTSIKDSLKGFDPSGFLNGISGEQAIVEIPDNLRTGIQPEPNFDVTEMVRGSVPPISTPISDEVSDMVLPFPTTAGSMFSGAAPEHDFWDAVADGVSGFFQGIGNFFGGIADALDGDGD